MPQFSNHSCDILAFWKAHAHEYPVLSMMAKDYLTVQASSVPAERAFSSGGNMISADRCSLSGAVVEKVQILKVNLPNHPKLKPVVVSFS